MNKTVTSKEAILAASKTLLLEKGAAAFNMRGVAESCGIAVGSLYNYFPSKSALVSATIESIWIDIFRSFITAPAFASFADCADALCTALSEGEERHPGFFTLHALSFAASDKAEGRALMARGFATLRAKMCETLRKDPAVRPDIFCGALSPEAFVDYILQLAILQHLRGTAHKETLLALIHNAIY